MPQKDEERSYVAACQEHGNATDVGDARRANRAHTQLQKALSVLRARPDRGAAFLVSATRAVDANVRCWAAAHLLPLDEVTAIDVLEALESSERPFVAINAQFVLQEWKAGRLEFP